MNKLRFATKKGFTAVLITLALVMCLGVLFAAFVTSGLFNASADTVVGDRIEMKDLFKRYPMDAVIGPIDVADTYPINEDGTVGDGKIDRNDLNENGKFTYIEDEAHKDINGDYTNNIYGIPASRYFDVESYIYTEPNSTGRTLFGWKPAIQGVNPGTAHKTVIGAHNGDIAENGEIMNGGYLTENEAPIGIYVYYNGGTNGWFGTTFKYALIVPEDITTVGQGSAAFVAKNADGNLTSYYANGTYPNSGSENVAKFTDFSSFYNCGTNPLGSAPYCWQPRERLAGVFFPENSRLTTIEGSASTAIGNEPAGTSKTASIGKAAFQDCNNMRYMVLPSGVKSIGQHAFYRCSQLADTNIPSTVESIGYRAYNGCKSLLHISLPDNTKLNTIESSVFDGCTKISHVDNGGIYEGTFAKTDSMLFVMGNKPENGVLDTGAFVFEKTGSALSALSLAGQTGESDSKLFVFPSAPHFTNTSDRRSGVTYDYLDCDGHKVKNSLDGISVTEYDIADNFAVDTWCQNVILPKEVKTIGVSAFQKSHVKYLETYATTIKANAFNDDNSNDANQWFYFHQIKNGGSFTKYDIASNAFVGAASNVKERHIVFENRELYAFATSTATANGNFKANVINKMSDTSTQIRQYVHYQIPIIAHIDNEDSQTVTIDQSDMEEFFYNDSDYAGVVSVAKGSGTITYTKRLSNSVALNSGTTYYSKSQSYAYNYVKQRTGAWGSDPTSAAKSNNPALSNMSSTNWFNDDTYASALENGAQSAHSGSTDSANISTDIYTKNIARPANIKNGSYDGVYEGKYTFGETYMLGGTDYTLGDDDLQCIDFYLALGLSTADYTLNVTTSTGVKTCDFAYPNGDPGVASNLHNAGTYSFAISLNPKWGVWSDDFKTTEDNKGYFNATITVERKKLDYSTLDSIPVFVNALGDSNVMHGNSTPIYNYNDGWYVAQQNGQEPNDTRTVTNSYVYHTGSPITIKLQGEVVSADGDSSTLGDVRITSRNGLTFADSNRYTASFQFEVKTIPGNTAQSNYEFDYGDNNYGINDEVLGISMSNTQWNSFRLAKRWYIVVETNMFTVGKGNASPYSPLINPNIHYADAISVQAPSLYKGDGTIEYEIVYTRTNGSAIALTGKEADGSNTKLPLSDNSLSYYINSSMPAGVYTLKLYGSAASDGEKTYPAITGEYVITVLPKEFDSDTVQAIHDIMNVNGSVGNAYPLDRNKALHDSIDDEVDVLIANLKMPETGNYWSDKSQYFDNKVSVSYNIDGRGNTTYYGYDEALGLLTTANPYRLYYCISAKNYKTVGGADSADRTDRVFITTLYTELRFADLVYSYITDVNGSYFKNVTYTGEVAQTRVPNNTNYTHAFTDNDYVNARTKASVTLTLNNPDLARWNTTAGLTEEQQAEAGKYFELSADGKSLKVFFDIVPATNSWLTAPLVPGWSYGEFDAAVYTVMGTLNYPATVHYFISTTNNSQSGMVVGPFTVDELGQIVDPNPTAANSLTSQLNKLDVGTYYLGSYADATEDGNVQAFDTLSVNGATYMPIVLRKAYNDWNEYPGMTSWQYMGFAVSTNFAAGTPKFTTYQTVDGSKIANVATYTVSQGSTVLATFKANDSDIESKLKNLSVLPEGSNYTLQVTYPSDNNYREMTYGMPFNVMQANNTWTTSPNMAGWQYSYFAIGNFRAGVPQFPLTNKVVMYGIFTSREAEFTKDDFDAEKTTGRLFSDISAVETYLKELKVGTYSLVAYVQGNTDYDDLLTPVSFGVTPAQTNAWTTIPSISNWTYNQFVASLVTAGATQFSNDVVYSVKINLDDDNGIEGFNELTFAQLTGKLNELGQGRYYLYAETVTSDNYAQATRSIGFTVAKANNAWATYPDINGWVYGAENVDYANKPDTKGLVKAVTTSVAGEATVKGNVEYRYYPATLRNGEWVPVTDAEAVTLSAATPYGDYVMIATAYGADNFNDLTHTVHFTVTKSGNNWENEPEGTFTWTWGAVNTVITDKTGFLTALAHFMPEDELVTYTVKGVTNSSYSATATKRKNADGAFDRQAVIDMLAALPVGDYEITVSVEETTNYAGISKITYVTVLPATINVTVEPDKNASWTWNNVSDAGKSFTAMKAEGLEGDVINIAYALSGVTEPYASYEALMADLKDYPVGNYTVTVTASYANYATETRYVQVAISNATFTWNPAPTNASWTWNNKNNDGKTVIEPVAYYLDGTTKVGLTYTIGSTTYTFSELEEYLLGANATVYNVNVTATVDNYNPINEFFTVTVNKATNRLNDVPEELYDFAYADRDKFVAPTITANFGTVVYYSAMTGGQFDDSKAIPDLVAWVRGFANEDINDTTPHKFYAVVKGDGANYDTVYAELGILITNIKSEWVNADTIADNVNLPYSNALSTEFETALNTQGDVKIPYGNTDGTTSYAIKYYADPTSDVATKETDSVLNNITSVMNWIKGIGAAGKYVIQSHYKNNSDGYTELDHTLTVTVALAEPQWDNKLTTSYYYGQYSKIEVHNISLKGYSSAEVTVEITVPGSEDKITLTIKNGKIEEVNGELIREVDRLTFAEYAQTLPAVQTYYEVKYWVTATVNHGGLPEERSRLYISPIVNTWLDTTDGDDVISADKWTNGFEWTFTRGNEITVQWPTAVTGNDTISVTVGAATLNLSSTSTYPGETSLDKLNYYLNHADLKQGTHSIVFAISQSNNYNGLVSNCRLVINLNSNSWTTKFNDTYDGTGSVTINDIDIPAASVRNLDGIDLLRFNITKANGSPLYSRLTLGDNVENPSIDTLYGAIATLTDGTYIITAYIGGSDYSFAADSPSQAALNKYNSDYVALVSTCAITVTPHANSWGEGYTFSGQVWTWNALDASKITMPNADYGNDTIVYTVRNESTGAVEMFKASKYGYDDINNKTAAEQIYADFVQYLQGLNSGTYSVTVSIEGTDVYNAPVTLTAVYVVNPVTTKWNIADADLKEYEFITVTWNKNGYNVLPNLALSSDTDWTGEGKAIVYSLNGAVLKDDESTQGVNESNWAVKLNTLSAGRYTFTASVAGDANHTSLSFSAVVTIEKVVSSWTTETDANNGKQYNWIYNSSDNVVIDAINVNAAANKPVVYTLSQRSATGTLTPVKFTETDVATTDWNAVINTLKAQHNGEYVIAASVEGDDNHTALNYSVTVMVSLAQNSWTTHMIGSDGNNTVVWTFGAEIGIGENKNKPIQFQATNNNEKLVYTVDGDTVSPANLAAALAKLSAGDHSIVAFVDADTRYGALSETIKLTIKKASNQWLKDKELNIEGWVWNDVNQYEMSPSFTAPVPAQGTTSSVTVRKGNVIILEASLSYTGTGASKVVNSNDYDALVRKLCALDVGTYSIAVVVNETDNYAALSAGITVNDDVTTYTTEFTITKANNAWKANSSPKISGWSFGGDIVYPSATPMFGQNTVQFSYTAVKDESETQPAADAKWSDAPGYMAGFYWLRTYVRGTENYNELTHYLKFEIGAGQNEWVKYPGVIAWSWNGYDKDANLFSGSARSNGQVSYTITVDDGSENGRELAVKDFYSYDNKVVVSESTIEAIRNKLKDFTLDEDGKVSNEIAAILGVLRNGDYLLTATAAGGESLLEITSSAGFTIGKANNEWKTAPNVLSFDFGATIAGDERSIFTAGTVKYGTVIYAINGAENAGPDNVERKVSLTGLTADDIDALIKGQYKVDNEVVILNAGNYSLTASVAASATYNELTNSSPIYFSVSRIANSWVSGSAPKTSVEDAYYADLRAQNSNNEYTFDFATWFGNPLATDGVVMYTLLKTNYQPAVDGSFDYSKLPEKIRELPSGDYIVRMNVDATCNYLALTAYASVSILRYANSFTKFPAGNLSGTWHQASNGVDNATTLTDFDNDIAAAYGDITYTIGATSKVSYSEFKAAVTALNAGSYQVVIEVAQTDDYNGLTRTVQLDIEPGTNVLNWSIVEKWNWHDGLTAPDGGFRFVANKPLYGAQFTVVITNNKDSDSSSTITVNFDDADPLTIINQIISGTLTAEGIVGGLGAGEYTIRVTASATTNWMEVSKSETFTIEKALNGWNENGSPELDGTLKDGVYAYKYGNAITPSAAAKYGAVKYTYYVNNADYANGNAQPLKSKPENVGSYVVEVSVDETSNYKGITAIALYFDIDKVLNDGFIVSAAAVGWTWGDYNRKVHTFNGIPRSGGNVSFSILDANNAIVIINGIALDKMLLVDENGVHHNDFDKDLYVSDALIGSTGESYASLISKLTEGSYRLQINVDETENNIAFTAVAPFRVDAAVNGWNVTPKIASWALEKWSEKENMPKAEPKFGTPVIVVTSQNNNEVYYDSANNVNRLSVALAGWYTMTVTVDALEGCYTGLKETVEVQVYMRGTTEKDKNSWYELPGIDSWEAIVNGVGNEPYGKPLRGLPYFEFYYAKGEGAGAEIDWDRPVIEGEDSFLVEKGENKYYKDFYMPMAPGYYFMVACAVNVDGDGNVIEADNLREVKTPYPLHIENRKNTFTDDPHIDTLLFLGDRENWANPTATASLEDSTVWFTYTNLDTGEDLGTTKPNDEGKYRVTAHILAKYSKEETKHADFTVELSTNEWLEQPSIADWSEESADNDPIASAKYGHVTYTYENLATGEIFTEKPTTEGEYKMTATVKAKGYKDLVSTSTFTIDPAYDRDLLLIDIILGFVGCALAAFVIIFAIRRYREN